MRVIAGKYRSRRLASLPGLDIRPTSDRLRETLFNVLTAGNPDALQGSSWLDLFAGTGAVGIEALSRGASKVVFVEQSRPATELIRSNLEMLGLKTFYRLMNASVLSALPATTLGSVLGSLPAGDLSTVVTTLQPSTLRSLLGSLPSGTVTQILAKLRLHSISELVRYAIRNRIIEP